MNKGITVQYIPHSALLWEYNLETMKMRVINNITFPNPNFICSMIFSLKMSVFLAAALDMSFKIYDRNLDLLESIRHDERAILQLEYDATNDIFLASGASGKSVINMMYYYTHI